ERRDELIELPELEGEAQDDRDDPQDEEPPAVVMRDRIGCEMAGEGAREQDDCVDHRYRIPVDIELIGARGRWRRPLDVGADEIEVHREEAAEEHHLGSQEDVHAHHSGLDRRVLRALRLVHRGDCHQCSASPPAALASYIFTSSNQTQPTTPIRKTTPPMTASAIRASEAKGMAASPRNRAPRQMTNGQLLFGKMWMPSSCARAS